MVVVSDCRIEKFFIFNKFYNRMFCFLLVFEVG